MNYIPENELGWFKKKICLKSKSVDEISGSSIGIFSKILILVISGWAIVTTILAIVNYVTILKEPNNDQNLSNGWCITMLILNGSLLIASIIIFFIVLLSFKSDSDKKKAMKTSMQDSKGEGAVEGALVASVKASSEVIEATAKAAATFASQNVRLEQEEAIKLGKGVLEAGIKAGNAAVGPAAQRATNAVNAASANGQLDAIAAGAAVAFNDAGKPQIGNLLGTPSSTAAAGSAAMADPPAAGRVSFADLSQFSGLSE
jgi:hypothetical protein